MTPDPATRSLVALGVLVAACLAMPLLSPWDPLAVQLAERLTGPASGHWLGTDELGRDVLSRIFHGAALTMTVSALALVSSLAIGIVLGACAGYTAGRWPDQVFSWVADLLTSIPFIVVLAAVLSITGPGTWKAYAVLTAIIWVGPARIVRAEVMQTISLEYVLAERALGASETRILFRIVVPSCVQSAILFSVGYLPEIIAIEAGLSFMGLGVQPPQPGLGKMIFDGIGYITSAWWLAIFPAAMLFVLVTIVQSVAWVVHRRSWQGRAI